MTTRLSASIIATAALLAAAPVAAQLLPGVGGTVGGVTQAVGNVARPVLGAATGDPATNAERGQLIGGAFDRVASLSSSVATGSARCR